MKNQESFQPGVTYHLFNRGNNHEKIFFENKKYDRRGSLFQEHLKRNIIDTDEYFKNIVLYIHLNSDHHKLNLSYENYPFSSYPEYVNGTESFIDKVNMINLFGDMDNFIYLHKQKKINMDLLDDINDLDD